MTRLKIALVAVLVVSISYALVTLYNSDLFAVEHIEIIGSDRVSEERILEVAGVPEDATLLRFPGSDVKRRLEADPWISEAVVARDFPDTMRIRVTERAPVAYVDTGTEEYWLVDDVGFVVALETPETTATLVVVRDLEGFDPVVGESSEHEPLLNALAVWTGLGPELKEMTRAILAAGVDKTTLVTNDDIQILVGSAEDIGRKDLIAREILQEHEGRVVYVNVRTVDRPTWRAIDE